MPTLDEAWSNIETLCPPEKGWGLTVLRYHLSDGPGLEYRARVSKTGVKSYEEHGPTPTEALMALRTMINGIDTNHEHLFEEQGWYPAMHSMIERCSCGARRRIELYTKEVIEWPDGSYTEDQDKWPDLSKHPRSWYERAMSLLRSQ